MNEKTYESEWRSEIFLFLQLMGMNVQCEVHTSIGRADCIVTTADFIYIFEFKLDRSADAALKQIEEKSYAEPYKASSQQIIRVGVSFSTKKQNIEEWKAVRS